MVNRIDIEQLRAEVGTFEVEAAREADSLVTNDTSVNTGLAFTTDAFAEDPQRKKVLAACHKALSVKAITKYQLREKLHAGEHDDELIEWAITRCEAAGLINDEAYARSWVQSRVKRGQGARRIEQDLMRKGIDRQLISIAIVDTQAVGAFDQNIIEAAQKKAKNLDLSNSKDRMKLQRWLASRGYSSEQIHTALRAIQQ